MKNKITTLLLFLATTAIAGLPPVSITGENYLSKPALNKIQANPVNLAGTNVTGTLPLAKVPGSIPASKLVQTDLVLTESQITNLITDLASKQATGNYLTALTGDVTASGPGSSAATLATVNSSPGSFGSASTSLSATVNGKGLLTSLSSQSIQLAESQVTSLVSDLALKAPLASPTFTGTVTIPSGSNLSTPATLVGTNITGLPLTTGVTGILPNANTTGTSVNSPSTLVARDASGNFTAADITANNFIANATMSAQRYTSTIGTGTAPFTVTSTTRVSNLNVATAGNADTVTTNANLTGPITSVGNATSVAAQTGTGSVFVMQAGSPNFTGNVGIGTTTPGYKLDATGGGGISERIFGATADVGMRFENTAAGGRTYHVGSTGSGSGAGNGFSIYDITAGATRLLLNPSGNVGIGTTTPNHKLEVIGNAKALNHIDGLVSRATDAGTYTLNSASEKQLYFTGTLNNDVALAATGLPAGTSFRIVNGSSGLVNLYASAGIYLQAIQPGFEVKVTSLVASATAVSDWNVNIRPYNSLAGSKNYIGFNNYENGLTTGWTATGVATVTNGLPVSVGSGGNAFSSSNGGQAKGANTNSPAVDSTSALSGTFSLNYATTGAGVIGDGYISSKYNIDASDQAKVLSYKLNYKVAAGTPVMAGTSANTYAVAIYDPVNNAWLPVAGGFNFVQSSGQGIAQGTFQTASNTTSIQIFIYSPVAPTGTSSLLIDDVYVGPQALAFGPPVSDLTSFTPAVTGFGTSPTVVGRYRRVGDTLVGKIQVDVTNTSGAGSFSIGTFLPSGLSVDTSKILKGNTNQTIGKCFWINASTGGSYSGSVTWNTGGALICYGDSGVQQWSSTVPAAVSTSTIVYVEYELPVTGWSSSSVMSADSTTRAISMGAYKISGGHTSSGNWQDITSYDSVQLDNIGTFNSSTGVYTVGVTGNYLLAATAVFTSNTGGLRGVRVQKGSSTNVGIGSVISAGAQTGDTSPSAFGIIPLIAGDTIKIQAYQSSAGSLNYDTGTDVSTRFSVMLQTGPATIAASESVNARWYDTGGQTIGTSMAIYKFTTSSFDSHSAYSSSTGLYTCPISGKYEVSTQIFTTGSAFTVGNNFILNLYKNGSFYSYIGFSVATGASSAMNSSGTDTVSCNAGETLAIWASNSTSTTSNTATQANHVSFKRIGN